MLYNYSQKLLSIKKIKQLLKNREKPSKLTYNTKIIPPMRKIENNTIREITSNSEIIDSNVTSNDNDNKINNNNSTNINNINSNNIPKINGNSEKFLINKNRIINNSNNSDNNFCE